MSNPINIITLIDSFKNSFTTNDANDIFTAAFQNYQQEQQSSKEMNRNTNLISIPIADGGEGYISSFSQAVKTKPTKLSIQGPLNTTIESEYLDFIHSSTNQRIIVIESAQVGIQLVPTHQLNPKKISTFGIGQQIRHILLDCHNTMPISKIIIGLGGTASVDCGIGILQGLLESFKCYDMNGDFIPPFDVRLGEIDSMTLPTLKNNGINNHDINNYDIELLHKLYSIPSIVLASDVTNPLLGKNGAVYIFGQQKGIKPNELEQYEANMTHFVHLLIKSTQSPLELLNLPGTGAAGGIAMVFYCLFYHYFSLFKQSPHHDKILFQSNNHINSTDSIDFIQEIIKYQEDHIEPRNIVFQSGFDVLLQYTTLYHILQQITTDNSDNNNNNNISSIIFTGEGCFDEQSMNGKVISRVYSLSQQFNNIPIVILTGRNQFESSSTNTSNSSLLSERFPNIVLIIDINDKRYHIDGDDQINQAISIEEKIANGKINFKAVVDTIFGCFKISTSVDEVIDALQRCKK